MRLQVFIAFSDDHFESINTGNFSIREPEKEIAKKAMALLGSYLESDKSFKVDPSFAIYITMISIAHTRQRRIDGKNVTKVGANHDPSNPPRWAFEFPVQFIADTELWDFLNDNCLLVSTALGLIQLKKPLVWEEILKIRTKRSNTKNSRRDAKEIIKQEVKEILQDCPDVSIGPHVLEKTLVNLCNFYKFQATVFNRHEPNFLYFKYPREVDFSLPQVWYYLDDENHIKMIFKKLTFGNKYGRGFCPGCNTIIKSHQILHKCPKLDACFACYRPYQAENYFIDPSEAPFCDGKLKNNSGDALICEECNYTCYSPLCLKLHKAKICDKVWYCPKCDQYFKISSTFENKEAMKNHNCNEVRCKECHELVDKNEKDHQCKLSRPPLPSIWPRMAFVDFQDCLKEESEKHKYFVPYFATAMIELKEPGIFHSFHFADNPTFLSEKEKCPGTFFAEEYWGAEDRPQFGVAKNTYLKDSKPIFKEFKTPKDPKASRTLEEQVIIHILLSCHREKTTIVAKNSNALTHLLRGCLSLKLQPEIIAKERNLISVRCSKFGLSIISSESYYPFSMLELNDLFDVYSDPFFFPTKLNPFNPNVRNYCGPIHKVEFWEEFNDTDEVKTQKIVFIQLRADSEWCFKSELIEFSRKSCFVLAKACLAYINEAIKFQLDMRSLNLHPKKQKRTKGEKTPMKFFHPMDFKTFTRASFLMTCFLAIENRPTLHCINREYVGGVQSHMSKKEIMWLTFNMKTDLLHKHENGISSASGQKRFHTSLADNYIPEMKKVLYFNGCYWHNCPCQAEKADYSLRKKSIELRQNQLEKNLHKIERECGVKIEVLWECQFSEMVKVEPMKSWYANNGSLFHPGDRLKPRDAIFGGFAEVFCFLWSKQKRPTKKLFSIDINSLYPYCGQIPLPVGKPETLMFYDIRDRVTFDNLGVFIKKRESDILEPFLGLIYCSILPPTDGFMSDYPYIQKRTKNGLVAGLCAKCIDESNKDPCSHSDEERRWNSVLTSTDINFCLRHGYKIVEIWELMHYSEKSPFLADMLKVLGRGKIMHDGIPPGEQTEEYTNFVNDRMGFEGVLKLDPGEIDSDKRKKKLAKQNLVSFIGKFMQSNLKNRTQIIHNYSDLFEILVSSKEKVINVRPVSDESVAVITKTEKDGLPPQKRSNCIVGAMILSEAKKTLFTHMQTIHQNGGRLLMVDTDSITFEIGERSELNIEGVGFSTVFGDFKHNYTNTIVNFLALASKNYCVTTNAGGVLKQDIKMRGMTLKNENVLSLVANEYERMVEDGLKGAVKSVEIEQERQNTNFSSTERSCGTKIFVIRNAMSKNRVIVQCDNEYETKPFGYK